jgi:hypothetical protein
MKRIDLPEVTFTIRGPDGKILEAIGAARQLYNIVSFPPPQKGLTLDDIRQRIPLCDKLIGADSVLVLEDSEYATLSEAFQEASWSGVSKDIIALADALADAKTVNVEEVS